MRISRFLSGVGLSVVALVSLVSLAHADISYTGTTVGGPLWIRPEEDLSEPAIFAGEVPYQVQPFYVDTDTTFSFFSLATNPEGWDNFLVLYEGGFDASQPLLNAIAGSDDYNGVIGNSGFDNVFLKAGTQYYLVTTGFSDNSEGEGGGEGPPGDGEPDAGEFNNDINGPGTITLGNIVTVPESGTFGLLALGLSATGVALVRRRRSN